MFCSKQTYTVPLPFLLFFLPLALCPVPAGAQQASPEKHQASTPVTPLAKPAPPKPAPSELKPKSLVKRLNEEGIFSLIGVILAVAGILVSIFLAVSSKKPKPNAWDE